MLQEMINQIDNYLNGNPIVSEPTKIGIIVTENQTFDGKSNGTYSNPIIPKGFAPINENGAEWGTEDGYKKGLVITDKVDEEGNSVGNEFVWVPVDGSIVKFERYNFGKMNSNISSFEDLIENVPDEITKSVNTNEGFYIARYEAGIAKNMPQEQLSSDSTITYGGGDYKPISKQSAIVWNWIQWGINNDEINPGNGAVTVARSMYPKEDTNYGAASTLIYGVQWDTTLNFIGAYDIGEVGYKTYATDSTGMGNYREGDEFINKTEPTTCGASEFFKQKNIYDMAGNVWEWSMETYNVGRIPRGGSYGGFGVDDAASIRINSNFEHSVANKRF